SKHSIDVDFCVFVVVDMQAQRVLGNLRQIKGASEPNIGRAPFGADSRTRRVVGAETCAPFLPVSIVKTARVPGSCWTVGGVSPGSRRCIRGLDLNCDLGWAGHRCIVACLSAITTRPLLPQLRLLQHLHKYATDDGARGESNLLRSLGVV